MQLLDKSDEGLTSQQIPARTWKYWRLDCVKGRQRWVFDPPKNCTDLELAEIIRSLPVEFKFDKQFNPNAADQVYRYNRLSRIDSDFIIEKEPALDFPNSLTRAASHARNRCLHALGLLQDEDGHWPGDYGGPHFLLPALVFTSHISNTPFPAEKRVLMMQYMLNHQNEDGGWGLHIEGESKMFGTVMQYCALRLLGAEPSDNVMVSAREWILSQGGATNIPSWGKVFLSILGVYEWEGCNSLLPELWLLPRWFALHPSRYWCHARMVYLPMSYCYGNKVTGKVDGLIKEIRREIYNVPYAEIKWRSHRNDVCDSDIYRSASGTYKFLSGLLNKYENWPNAGLRRKALKFALDYIDAEDQQTEYIDIGPVNQILNSVCSWHAYGPDSKSFKSHVSRWDDYLWLAEDGMKMNGYNGSQLWDTAFTVQAILENKPSETPVELLSRAYAFIDYSQIKDEVPNGKKFFRHASIGGWPFSTLEHGWPIADCTAEALKATINIHREKDLVLNEDSTISKKRLFQAADLLLTWQNSDGGWATYENKRGGSWLELLNPSEIFGEIMVDYSWVECTSACVTALVEFQTEYPDYCSSAITKAIREGVAFIKDQQNSDGSWMGSWGVCFTYGTWFAVEALVVTKKYTENDDALNKACQFLLSCQNEDGGWGESHRSCTESKYIYEVNSQVVNTSWALLSLMGANHINKEPVDNGIKFLMSKQQKQGEWPQQRISGVFNKTCMITYSAYRNIFPVWALGRYLTKYNGVLKYKS